MGKTKSRFLKTKKGLRILMRVIGVLSVLLVGIVIYVLAYGIPDGLLRVVIRHANEAGIAVDVSHIKFSLHGWRADNVRYFSSNPADEKPIFKADTVYFSRHLMPKLEGSGDWILSINAQGVELSPSVEWGIEIPEKSPVRNIEDINLTLAFLPDQIKFSDGTMHWLGSTFTLNGSFVKASPETIAARLPKSERSKKVKQKTVSPVYVSKEKFQNLEDRINAIQVEGAATVDIGFYIDANDYSVSTLKLEAKADRIALRGVEFSQAAISVNYCYPGVQLEHMALYRDGKAAQLTARYDLGTNVLQGTLSNTIVSSQPLQLLPVSVQQLLEKLDMHFGQLPLFEINVASCAPADVLNHISGTFSIDDFAYAGSTIKTLAGKLARENDRLELSELTGTMQGLEDRAAKTGSSMLGGSASGSAYFDSSTYWFGVDADINLDPTLLIGPLSLVRIATNVLHRFKFNGEEPPKGHIELGSCVTNWSTFFIDVELMGENMTVHEAEFSSVDLLAAYTNKILVLDPLTAMQGTNDLTGTITINFAESTADVDILTSMQPIALQNAAYPPLGVFGKSIKTAGAMDIKAKGLIDWKRMQATNFEANIIAEELELPLARLTNFTGTVLGKGPVLSLQDAQFTLYDGMAEGGFSLEIDPEKEGMPYAVDLHWEQVDFRQFLQFFKPEETVKASGLFENTISVNADLKKNFFESANGTVSFAVTKGQLADLPFFDGFSSLMRKLLPSFNVFSFTGINGDLKLEDGIILTENANLVGELISAKARGSYSQKDGFDAYIQVQTFSDRFISRVVRVITDPLLKLFEIRLTGTISDPTWTFD